MIAPTPDRPFVFISYQREDILKAEHLQKQLERDGLATWKEDEHLAGERCDDVVMHAIHASACVVVLWSKAAVRCAAVKDAATLARRLERLVPAVVERGVKPPWRFRWVHTHVLTDWISPVPGPHYMTLRRDARRLVSGVRGGAEG